MQAKLQPRGLPQSLHGQFKLVLKHHDKKDYKKGLKCADAILKQVPEHGETMALKALIFSAQGKKQEAYDNARQALKNDVCSALCWDVLSNLHRREKNYKSAIKCAMNALLHAPDNVQIIKDLAGMCIQVRDYKNFEKYSYQLLIKRPQNHIHWMGYATSSHLNGESEKAIDTLKKYQDVRNESSKKDAYEGSEMLFFHETVLEESGDIEGAYKFLQENEKEITDKECFKLKSTQLLLSLGRTEEAIEIYKELIDRNPEHWDYHRGYLCALGLIPKDHKSLFDSIDVGDKTQAVFDLYKAIGKKQSRAKAPKQIPLSFATGDTFREMFTEYVGPYFTKGTTSLFNTLKYLYRDCAKVKIMEESLLYLRDLVERDKPLPGETELEPPTTILFINYFLAQHYNNTRESVQALKYCEMCIEHTPTQVEFYILKGRIYKDAGNVQEAAIFVEEARTLDLADRYLNTKATRYFLRAHKVQEAEQILSIFTKVHVKTNSDAEYNNVHTMQVSWYEQEAGRSWLGQKDYGKALVQFTRIISHFEEFWHDQTDFHQYCMRKMTIRQYIAMLRFEDKIEGHSYFFNAACGAVKCYLAIHDNPTVVGLLDEKELSQLSPAERAKAIQKKKQRDAKKAKAREERKKAALSRGLKGNLIEDDPDGDLLVGLGLEKANEFIHKLLKFSGDKIESHLLAFEVSLRRQKYLIALRSLNHARRIDPTNPEVHEMVIKLFLAIDGIPNEAVTKVISLERENILGGLSLQDYHKQNLKPTTVKERLVYYRCCRLLNEPKESLVASLTQIDNYNCLINDCVEVYETLKENHPEAVEDYKKKCHELFPFASAFVDEEIQQEQEQEK